MSLLYSKSELELFISLLPQLGKDECWFVSLSARNKYLDGAERDFYHLGRTEMFAREFIYETHIDNFMYVLESLDAQLTYRKTKSGQLFPEKALIVYFNINPASGIKAYMDFQKEMNKELADLVNGLEKGHDNSGIYNRFKKCQSILKSSFQTQTSRKIFLDIDFDTKDMKYLDEFLFFCDRDGIKYVVVDTKSGFHVCLLKETITTNFMAKVQELDKRLKSETFEGKGEIILNKNEMVPLPGTKQGLHEVRTIRGTIECLA